MNISRGSLAKTLLLLTPIFVGLALCNCGTEPLAFGQGSGTSASGALKFDGPAELPRIYLDSSLRSTPAPGKTVKVRAGENPSEAISKASCGDTVQLQAGATFDILRLPNKNCDDSHWIIVRTSAPDSKLPPEGTRLTPCYAGVSSPRPASVPVLFHRERSCQN